MVIHPPPSLWHVLDEDVEIGVGVEQLITLSFATKTSTSIRFMVGTMGCSEGKDGTVTLETTILGVSDSHRNFLPPCHGMGTEASVSVLLDG